MSAALPSARRLNLHFIAMQGGFWAMFSSICAYQAALLSGRGFTNGEIGFLIAARCLAGILCQPLLGGFADRNPQIPLRRITALSLSLGLTAGLVFYLVPMGMGGTLAVLLVMGGFEISAYPLMDAMAVQFINAGIPIHYSLARGIGSLSYAVVCILLGIQVTGWGVESTLITHTFLTGLEITLIATYPVFRARPAPEQGAPASPHSVIWLLRQNPAFSVMLLAILCSMTGLLPLANFLINVVLDRGGTSGNLGIALFLMAASELPAAFLFHHLYRRLAGGRLLLLSLFFCFLKALAFYLSPSLLWILLAQPLQMMGYGIFTPTSVYYVNDSIPSEDRVKGQTIMMVASNGMGGVLGSLLAGLALDLGGVQLMLLFSMTLCALGVLLSGVSLRISGRAALPSGR